MCPCSESCRHLAVAELWLTLTGSEPHSGSSTMTNVLLNQLTTGRSAGIEMPCERLKRGRYLGSSSDSIRPCKQARQGAQKAGFSCKASKDHQGVAWEAASAVHIMEPHEQGCLCQASKGCIPAAGIQDPASMQGVTCATCRSHIRDGDVLQVMEGRSESLEVSSNSISPRLCIRLRAHMCRQCCSTGQIPQPSSMKRGAAEAGKACIASAPIRLRLRCNLVAEAAMPIYWEVS